MKKPLYVMMLTLLLSSIIVGCKTENESDRPAVQTAWWQDAIFYQIWPRSFKDTDGDGIGDFKGITSQLDYLVHHHTCFFGLKFYLFHNNQRVINRPTRQNKSGRVLADLGITAIWLTPMFEAPSYHGYDFQAFYEVESDYGTMADFEELLDEAEKRGIKVIADLVLNHISKDNEWFIKSAQKEAPYSNFFIWQKDIPQGPWGKPWATPENPYVHSMLTR